MTNGTDEKTQFFIWAAIIAAVTGIYGFFLRHVMRHPQQNELNNLWEQKQSVDRCEQIVKRIDSIHKDLKEDLKEIKRLIRIRNGDNPN